MAGAGYGLNYPAAPPIITADQWAAPMEMYFAQKERQRRFNLAADAQAAKEKRDQQAHERGLLNIDLQNQQLQRTLANDKVTQAHKQAEDFRTAQKTLDAMGNPLSPEYEPTGMAAYGEAYGIHGTKQINMPEKPVVPSKANLPPELQAILKRGTAIREISPFSRAQEPSGAGLPPRPPSEAEFQQYAGTPEFLAGPVYGEQGEAGPIEKGQTREELLARGRARETLDTQRNPQYEAAAKSYLSERQQKQEELAAYPGKVAQANVSPIYQGTSKYGPVMLAPIEHQAAIQRIHNETADRIEAAAKAQRDPFLASEFASVASMVRNRMVDPDKATKQIDFLLSERNKLGIAEGNRRQQEKLAGMKLGSLDDMTRERQYQFDVTQPRKDEAEAEAQTMHVMQLTGFKGTLEGLNGMRQMLAKITSVDNPLEQSLVGPAFATFAQGPGNRLTDADYRNFWVRAGAPVDNFKNWASEALGGGLGAAKQEQAIRAAEDIMRLEVAQGKRSAIAAVRRATRADGTVDPNFVPVFNAYFSDFGIPLGTVGKGYERPASEQRGRGKRGVTVTAPAAQLPAAGGAALDFLNRLNRTGQ